MGVPTPRQPRVADSRLTRSSRTPGAPRQVALRVRSHSGCAKSDRTQSDRTPGAMLPPHRTRDEVRSFGKRCAALRGAPGRRALRCLLVATPRVRTPGPVMCKESHSGLLEKALGDDEKWATSGEPNAQGAVTSSD